MLAPDDPRHGTVNGYGNLKCRCQPCRDAWSARCKDLRAVRAARLAGEAPMHVLSVTPEHGRWTTYQNHGCRCEACTTAHTDYCTEVRRRHGVPQRRRFSDEVKAAAVRDAAVLGVSTVAKALGISHQTVHNWCQAAGIVPPRFAHGTTRMYDWGGCRCDDCRAADEAASVMRRLLPDIPHGTLAGYQHHSCRCADCRRARQQYDRRRRSTRGAA